MTESEKNWLVDRLRERAAEETVIGSPGLAAEFLLRAEAVAAGRRFLTPDIDPTDLAA